MYVLQLCRTEPAIWDGLISLSALFKRPPITDQSSPIVLLNEPAVARHEDHRDALAWYSRSLAGLRQRINRGSADVDVLLVGTVIYVAIEFLQANYNAVMGLYRYGTRLMDGNVSAESGPKSAVKAMFRRLRTQLLIFSGLSMGEDLPNQLSLINGFESIDSARNGLFELISAMKQLLLSIQSYRSQTGSVYMPSSHPLTTRKTQLEQRLHHWHDVFTSSFPCCTQPPSSNSGVGDSTTQVLLMNHTAILLETQTCLSASEIAYDMQKDAFVKILEYADAIISSPSPTPASSTNTGGKSQPFSFDLSTFLPLFITALKCRFPDLRRKALHLLSGTDTSATTASGGGSVTGVQGMFLARPAAQLVGIIVGLEEGTYPPPSSSDTTLIGSDKGEERLLLSTVVDDILARKGCIPREDDRICDFWISSQSVDNFELSSPPTLPSPSMQGKQHIDEEFRKKEGWLYYRQYIPLPLQDGGNEGTGERKMGYVTRRVRLPDGL